MSLPETLKFTFEIISISHHSLTASVVLLLERLLLKLTAWMRERSGLKIWERQALSQLSPCVVILTASVQQMVYRNYFLQLAYQQRYFDFWKIVRYFWKKDSSTLMLDNHTKGNFWLIREFLGKSQRVVTWLSNENATVRIGIYYIFFLIYGRLTFMLQYWTHGFLTHGIFNSEFGSKFSFIRE